MPNNIVITGDKYVGKSTLIKRCLDKFNLIPGGFVVGRTGQKNRWLSFYLVDPYDYFYNDMSSKAYQKRKYVIAERNSYKVRYNINVETFNKKGVELIDTVIKLRDIVIMDELGRFELKATKFQNKVFEALDSKKTVVAVIKDEHNRFLDKIRQREDIKLIRLTKNNREEVSNKTYKYLKELLIYEKE